MPIPAKERARKYRAKHPERMKEIHKRHSKTENRIVWILLNNSLARAKTKGLVNDLTKEWILEGIKRGYCEVSGIPFFTDVPGYYRCHPFAPSIDKINPRGPYTQENCRLIAYCVNMARSDWGDEVLLKMAEGIIKNKNK